MSSGKEVKMQMVIRLGTEFSIVDNHAIAVIQF